MKNHVKTIVTLAAITLFAWSGTQAEAQEHFKNRYSVGFGFTPEWQLGAITNWRDTPARHFLPSFGLIIETQFSRRSGLELGFGDRPLTVKVDYRLGGPISWETAIAHYLSLKLGYKFYSNILNFSAGFNVDFAPSNVNDEVYEGHDRYGLYLTISKDIPLYKGLILEPEVHVNPFLCDQGKTVKTTDYEGTFLGLGVKLKYRF